MTEDEASTEKVQRALDTLREHFESVLILATKVDDDGTTRMCFKGSGNQFARVGMARQYLIRDEAVVRYDSEIECQQEDEE